MSDRCEKCGQTTNYNGWPNYETWCVKLWIDNVQPAQKYWLARARAHQLTGPESDEVKSGVWTKEEAARFRLANELKEAYDEEAVELLARASSEASQWSDLLMAALGSVNWDRIAESLLEDLEEVQ